MMKKYLMAFLLIIGSSRVCADLYTGFRASRISGFTSDYLVAVADSMARNFNSAGTPAAVWILSFYGDNGNIYVQFPHSGSIAHCSFTNLDYSEAFLTAFDSAGTKVWLQMEPCAANVSTLIDLALTRYGHHDCVAGFGLDVEWLDAQAYDAGRQVTDAEAQAWEEQVQSYDSTYSFFLKHFTTNRMPPTYRGNLLLIDDSQGHYSYQNFISEMRSWGQAFPNNKVGFQFGYEWDKDWWDNYTDPPATLGNGLLANINNTAALFWVDFTLSEVFPVSMAVSENVTRLAQLDILSSYPNPFNGATTFRFSLDKSGYVRLLLFDLTGRLADVILEDNLDNGIYTVNWNAGNLPSGVYLALLQTRSQTRTHYITLVK